MKIMDGNQAAAYISYAFTEIAAIYPITPSTNMAENIEIMASQNKKNLFGTRVKVIEMQSEAGAAGTLHGSLQAGALSTTFTASQGLLLKLPNMFKISGELLPGVMHVASRSISTHALSIFGDHQDIYTARTTGWAMLSSSSVQEVMDLSAISHLSAIRSRIPFLHFFDGFRTSHEIQKIEEIKYDTLDRLIDKKAVQEFRDRALNPEHPVTRGTGQNEDIFFQARESQNIFYNDVPDIVNEYMQELGKITGREYAPFTYYGDKEATLVIIAMGSVVDTIKEVVDYLNSVGDKVGVLNVHLYRPFSTKYLFNVMPDTVERIAVLDRTKEPGAIGEPLYLDVQSAYYGRKNQPIIVGGRYGLSSKDTMPDQIFAVFNNLRISEPKNHFTIGIVDDVTFTSLPSVATPYVGNDDSVAAIFYGIGSDGTVGANKNTIKIIGENTNKYTQAYFAYDSKKAGGLTRSHLRFSNKNIRSSYLVTKPSFVSSSVTSYITKYDLLDGIQDNGIFLLNTIFDKNKILEKLPNTMKRIMAKKNISFYIINATKLSYNIGLPNKISTIMQAAFFKLTNIIEYEKSKEYMINSVKKTFANKDEDIILKNIEAINMVEDNLIKVDIDPEYINIPLTGDEQFFKCFGFKPNEMTEDSKNAKPIMNEFMDNVTNKINTLKGEELPVSAFKGYEDGTFENGSTNYEKRKIATFVPEWRPEACIQCNQCAFVCPHSAIRPFMLTEEELRKSPNNLDTIKAIGKGTEGLEYRIQVAPMDCTGCTACVDVCPVKGKALVMKPVDDEIAKGEDVNAEYLYNKVSYKDNIFNKNTVKGSQFAKPLFEFSGACAGCGETPYIKLVTQLYGERMMIANATGCSSIYGGYAGSTSYTTNACGEGPAWASSLFEDNAEYGFGMQQAAEALREKTIVLMNEYIRDNENEITNKINEFLLLNDDIENKIFNKKQEYELIDKLKIIKNEIIELIEKDNKNNIILKEIHELQQYIIKKSIWVIGGDGWAYDIGYGGIDHVLSTGNNINMLVLDTEVYSNTGGQSSKASTTGSIAKFTTSGKSNKKKDLAALTMTYGDVYVARVSMGANQNQAIRAIKEAAEYDGPSLIIAYSPCIAHGISAGLGMAQEEEKLATEVGYWPLIRYNPDLIKKGKNPLQLDSRNPKWDKYIEFLMNENRFKQLMKTDPERATELFEKNKKDAQNTWKYYQRLASMDYSIEKED